MTPVSDDITYSPWNRKSIRREGRCFMSVSLLDELGWKKFIGNDTGSCTGEPVSARDIRRYALSIDDPNPIYFDDQAAKNGKYGGLTRSEEHTSELQSRLHL